MEETSSISFVSFNETRLCRQEFPCSLYEVVCHNLMHANRGVDFVRTCRCVLKNKPNEKKSGDTLWFRSLRA